MRQISTNTTGSTAHRQLQLVESLHRAGYAVATSGPFRRYIVKKSERSANRE